MSRGVRFRDVLRSFAQWSRASEAEFSKTRGEMNGFVNIGFRSSNLDALHYDLAVEGAKVGITYSDTRIG